MRSSNADKVFGRSVGDSDSFRRDAVDLDYALIEKNISSFDQAFGLLNPICDVSLFGKQNHPVWPILCNLRRL